jgi:AcrR family transcriptional regulator
MLTTPSAPELQPVSPRFGTDHRHRLLEGMAHAVALKGYADTTIADIVREAGVSRRTFYEHFRSRTECLVALYVAASHNALKVLEDAIDFGTDWDVQLESAVRAFLAHLAQNPVLLRTLFLEMPGLGEAGLAARRRVHQDMARFIMSVTNPRQETRLLDPDMAMAAVGGINEWILQAIERSETANLADLAPRSAALIRSLARRSEVQGNRVVAVRA